MSEERIWRSEGTQQGNLKFFGLNARRATVDLPMEMSGQLVPQVMANGFEVVSACQEGGLARQKEE